MAGNTALDFVIGAVPLLGDVFDATFTANLRNIALMRQDLFVTVRYARRARYREGAATRGTRRQVTPMRNRAGSRSARATLDGPALLVRRLASRQIALRHLLPLPRDAPFERPEIGLVRHFLAVANPVAEVEVGQAEFAAGFDLP